MISVLVKSTMSLGQQERTSVVARLNIANVPVENGVVHFIESPLGIASKTVWQYLQVCADSFESAYLAHMDL